MRVRRGRNKNTSSMPYGHERGALARKGFYFVIRADTANPESRAPDADLRHCDAVELLDLS
jgi:hypothetical protein